MFKLDAVRKFVRNLLKAFLGLLTQPLEQDLNDALRAAANSVALAIILPASGLVFLADRPALVIGANSFVLILVWMAVTAIVTKTEQRSLTLARNLSLVSFWIAVTLVFVMTVELFFPDRWELPIRLLSVWAALLLAIPVHTLRNLPLRQALPMTAFLWLSMGVLTWRVMY